MLDEKQRTHLNIISEAETSQLLSEKYEMREGIALAMVTSRSGFAAGNWSYMAGKLC